MCAVYAEDSPSHCRNGRMVACQNRNTGQGVDGVYMADGGGRMRTRTAMLEISWLPRSLEGADASFWPANVCLFIFPGLRVFFAFGSAGSPCFFNVYIYIYTYVRVCVHICIYIYCFCLKEKSSEAPKLRGKMTYKHGKRWKTSCLDSVFRFPEVPSKMCLYEWFPLLKLFHGLASMPSNTCKSAF